MSVKRLSTPAVCRTLLLATLMLILLTGCQAVLAEAATPIPTTTPPPPTPTVDTAARAREIEATWQEVESLAKPHLEAGLGCEACHPDSAATAEKPSKELCLACHEVTIEELYEIVKDNGQPAHPAAHLEAQSCSTCHRGHAQVADPCSSCH